jgi:hypothetical protein
VFVGPKVGSISDGDFYRREVMLEDCKSTLGNCFFVGWEG